MRKAVTLILAIIEILLIYECLKTEIEPTIIVPGMAAGLLVFAMERHLTAVWERKVMRFLVIIFLILAVYESAKIAFEATITFAASFVGALAILSAIKMMVGNGVDAGDIYKS